eukprot:SAG22_NODE_696_length_7828_cov_35.057964_1_plen_139_part_00
MPLAAAAAQRAQAEKAEKDEDALIASIAAPEELWAPPAVAGSQLPRPARALRQLVLEQVLEGGSRARNGRRRRRNAGHNGGNQDGSAPDSAGNQDGSAPDSVAEVIHNLLPKIHVFILLNTPTVNSLLITRVGRQTHT